MTRRADEEFQCVSQCVIEAPLAPDKHLQENRKASSRELTSVLRCCCPITSYLLPSQTMEHPLECHGT